LRSTATLSVMSSPLPRPIIHRLERLRADAERAAHELDVHARDLMSQEQESAALAEALTTTQMVKAQMHAVLSKLDAALREAGADG
jgi:hypothetical protein